MAIRAQEVIYYNSLRRQNVIQEGEGRKRSTSRRTLDCCGAAKPEVLYQARSTVLTSQLPVSRWHEQIGDPTIADGIQDRLVHNAHRIEMRGESMRKKRNPPQDEKKE
jgi:hypothetical protein